MEMTGPRTSTISGKYRDEDVDNLIQAIEYGLENTPHGIHGSAVIRQRLQEIDAPSAEVLRRQRGKRAHDEYFGHDAVEADVFSTRTAVHQEEWCRVADAVLALKAEQDAKGWTR